MLNINPIWGPVFQDRRFRGTMSMGWWNSDVLIERLLGKLSIALIIISGAYKEHEPTLDFTLFPTAKQMFLEARGDRRYKIESTLRFVARE